jgi:hypothetical protein
LYLAPEDDDEKEETDGEAMEMGEKIKHWESRFVIIIPSGQIWEWDAKQI